MSKMAAGIYFTSAGIPFFQAGEEFLRTKYGLGDSYNFSANVNKLDWKRAYENRDIVDYYKELIAIRKKHHELYHMSDNDGLSVEFVQAEGDSSGKIQFVVDKKLRVVYNPTEVSVTITEE